MKYIVLFALSFTFIFSSAQVNELEIITVDGNQINLDSYLDSDKNHLIIFWASWCSICRNEKNTIESYYESWYNDYNTEVVSISTDRESARPNAISLFDSNQWPYDLVFAESADAQRTFGISGVPHTFLINQDREIIYQKRSFRNGDEIEIDQEIKDAFQASSNIENLSSNLDFTAYRQGHQVTVKFSNELIEPATLIIYNLNGQILAEKRVASGSIQSILNIQLPENQVFVVEFNSKNGDQFAKSVR